MKHSPILFTGQSFEMEAEMLWFECARWEGKA